MGSSRSKINTKYKVVDLFCGVGGLTLGLNNTKRFQTIFANDVDMDMCHAYSINFPDTEIRSETISSINFEVFPLLIINIVSISFFNFLI